MRGRHFVQANMHLAYELLSEPMKAHCNNLVAVHDIARVFARRLGKSAEELHKEYPPMRHPVVRTHPETGQRALYVNVGFTSYIEGLSKKESEWLLDHLFKSAWNVEIQCRFRWQQGSVAFWDNRVCQHFAVSDYFPARRVMERGQSPATSPFFNLTTLLFGAYRKSVGSLEHMGDLQMGGTQEQTYEEVVRGRKSIRGYL